MTIAQLTHQGSWAHRRVARRNLRSALVLLALLVVGATLFLSLAPRADASARSASQIAKKGVVLSVARSAHRIELVQGKTIVRRAYSGPMPRSAAFGREVTYVQRGSRIRVLRVSKFSKRFTYRGRISNRVGRRNRLVPLTARRRLDRRGVASAASEIRITVGNVDVRLVGFDVGDPVEVRVGFGRDKRISVAVFLVGEENLFHKGDPVTLVGEVGEKEGDVFEDEGEILRWWGPERNARQGSMIDLPVDAPDTVRDRFQTLLRSGDRLQINGHIADPGDDAYPGEVEIDRLEMLALSRIIPPFTPRPAYYQDRCKEWASTAIYQDPRMHGPLYYTPAEYDRRLAELVAECVPRSEQTDRERWSATVGEHPDRKVGVWWQR